MKRTLICAAIALFAALLSGGAASAASPALPADGQPGWTQAAPAHHYEGGHSYDRGWHHGGWHH